MSFGWVAKEEDDLLRGLVASMKTHDDEEWNSLRLHVYKQSPVMNEWESRPSASLENKFSIFWNLICIFAESIAENMTNLSKLEWSQKKRELQLGCLKGLCKFDVQGRSTVLGWLRVAWRIWDSNVGRRKGQQAEMAQPIIIGKDGKETPLVDLLPCMEGDPVSELELKEMADITQKFFAQRAPSSPWRIAAAVWLDDASYIEGLEEYPAYPPRARQKLARDLASGPWTSQSLYECTMPTDVFFRRTLWKKFSSMFVKGTVTPGNRRSC